MCHCITLNSMSPAYKTSASVAISFVFPNELFMLMNVLKLYLLTDIFCTFSFRYLLRMLTTKASLKTHFHLLLWHVSSESIRKLGIDIFACESNLSVVLKVLNLYLLTYNE